MKNDNVAVAIVKFTGFLLVGSLAWAAWYFVYAASKAAWLAEIVYRAFLGAYRIACDLWRTYSPQLIETAVKTAENAREQIVDAWAIRQELIADWKEGRV